MSRASGLQYGLDLASAQMQAILTVIGAAPVLELRTGPAPLSCFAADAGKLIAALQLPQEWATVEAGALHGGEWHGAAVGAGKVTHFRLKDAAGQCHIQGTADSVGRASLQLDDPSFEAGMPVRVLRFTLSNQAML